MMMTKIQIQLLVAAVLVPFIALAQQFRPVQENPFGMLKSDTLLLQGFAMADMNKDDLPDLLYTDDATFKTFLVLNKGAVGQPNFNGSPVIDFEDGDNGYGLGTFILFNSRMADLDDDHNIDHLFCYSSDDPNLPPVYIVELNQPELVPSENFDFLFLPETALTAYGIPAIPLFTYESFDYRDITGDSLPDILGSRIKETTGKQEFVFYERLSLNEFVPPVLDPFGLPSTFDLVGQPCLLDVDSDGDQDLLVLNAESGDWLYYKNEGSLQTPVFANPVVNPFNLSPVPDVGTTAFVIDINQDGKDDLMASNFENFYYYEFDAGVAAPTLSTASGVRIFPTLVRDWCHIVVDGAAKIEKILVQDLNGRIVTAPGQAQEVDFTAFVPGVYTVTIYLEGGLRYSQKVVKSRL